MKHRVFAEIDKFDKWAKEFSDIPQDDRFGEWEIEYGSWDWIQINTLFDEFITVSKPAYWTKTEKKKLLYIIARDNDSGCLISYLDEQSLFTLAEYAIHNGSRNSKWQLVVNLHRLTDKNLVLNLLERFVEDEDEYVNRCALLELAKLQFNNIEKLCEKVWNKDKYGKMEEYQRIAVLHSLKIANSDKIGKYIEMAKTDGRKYLVENAIEIENTYLKEW
jgi:hypothetical protein